MKAICRICGKEGDYVNAGHLSMHGVSITDYKLRFPEAELYSDSLKLKRSEQFKINNPMNSQQSKDKVSNSQKKRFNDNPGLRKRQGELTKRRNTGRIYPDYHRKAISEALMGHGFSEETLENMRGPRPSIQGKLNPNWHGGKSFEPYTEEFNYRLKEQIRKRDGYTCQLCRKRQELLTRKLAVHHIDYNKENCDSSNLISLCCSCSSKVNFDRKEWENRFCDMINSKEKDRLEREEEKCQ